MALLVINPVSFDQEPWNAQLGASLLLPRVREWQSAAQRTTWHPPTQSVVWLFCKAAGPQPVCILTSWGAAGPVAVPIRFPIWAHVWSCTFSCRLAATEKTTGPKGLWSGRWPKGAKGPARLSAPWTFCASWGCYLEPTQLSWWLECDSHPGHDQ